MKDYKVYVYTNDKLYGVSEGSNCHGCGLHGTQFCKDHCAGRSWNAVCRAGGEDQMIFKEVNCEGTN